MFILFQHLYKLYFPNVFSVPIGDDFLAFSIISSINCCSIFRFVVSLGTKMRAFRAKNSLMTDPCLFQNYQEVCNRSSFLIYSLG